MTGNDKDLAYLGWWSSAQRLDLPSALRLRLAEGSSQLRPKPWRVREWLEKRDEKSP